MNFFDNIDFNKIIGLLSYSSDNPMIFSSGLFFILFLLFYPIYIAFRKKSNLRIIYVVAFSLFFYYKSSGLAVLLLLIAASSDFLIGRMMEISEKNIYRKLLVLLSMLINLSILSYFKYFNFLAKFVYYLMDLLGIGESGVEWIDVDIILPVGISFYTFQTMSYIIDIYRKEISPVKKWIDYVFYVSFFPQLVAGPIVRAKDFIPQIYKEPYLSKVDFSRAIYLITAGLLKKVVISDYISVNFVDRIFDAPLQYTGLENLMAVYGYAMQIYCDFSGYSDMAIGIALLLGFQFNINFDSPYQSASITEFWRRWHISLSFWLKDYLYIPLGGNRKGQIRAYINLFITMLLGGLWHGAAWRFVIWGALHGIALAIHKLWLKVFPSAKVEAKDMSFVRKWIGRFITFNFVCFTYLFFRADDLSVISDMLSNIFSNFHSEIFMQMLEGYPYVFSLIVIGYILHMIPRNVENYYQKLIYKSPFILQAMYFILVLFIVVQFRSADVQAFIYFQF